MKSILKTVSLSALALSLGACSGAGNAVEKVADANEQFGCDVINVFSPSEYIGENVISNFETMYNARVNYDLFDSNEMMYTKLLGGSAYDVLVPSDYNEMMYTKLLGGSAYDVLVPSDYMIEQLMQEDMLQPIDSSAMTNIDLLDPDVVSAQKTFDPELNYSVPYFWGSVGLVYNTQTVDPSTIEEQGWNILHNTDYKGKIYFYDSQRDGFMVAFKALGYSMNTDNDEEINAAYEWLVEMNDTMEPAYVTDEVIDGMVNGDKDIAVMYSGDASYVLSENPDMAWIEPEQGTNIWVDAMVIPSRRCTDGELCICRLYIRRYRSGGIHGR